MADRYLTPGILPTDMAAAFRAAARLYRAAPWDVILTDDSLLSVSAESLGLRDAAVSVVGQHGSMFGLLLFPGGREAFSAFERVAPQIQRGGAPSVPPYATLAFVPRGELGPPMRKEITRHGWELAGPAAYPLFSAVDRDPHGRWPTRDELERLEAVALALAELVAVEPRLADATFGSDSFDRAIEVVTRGERRVMRMAAPNVPRSFDDEDVDESDEAGPAVQTAPAPAVAVPTRSVEVARKERNRRKADRRARR